MIVQQIEIAAGATGYGYNTVFGPYLDDRLTAAAVRDPYIRSNAQVRRCLLTLILIIADYSAIVPVCPLSCMQIPFDSPTPHSPLFRSSKLSKTLPSA